MVKSLGLGSGLGIDLEEAVLLGASVDPVGESIFPSGPEELELVTGDEREVVLVFLRTLQFRSNIPCPGWCENYC